MEKVQEKEGEGREGIEKSRHDKNDGHCTDD
jgi:hypothetical protein